MGIALSLMAIAIGAVLAFATNVTVSGLDLAVVGWILMLIGVLGLVLSLVIWPRRRATRVDRVERAVPPGQQVVERQVYEDPPL